MMYCSVAIYIRRCMYRARKIFACEVANVNGPKGLWALIGGDSYEHLYVSSDFFRISKLSIYRIHF